jgi:DNA polymerase-2
MTEHTGWLLDLYPDPQAGVALWLLEDDGVRTRFTQSFPVTFYAAGPAPMLRSFWRYLQQQPYHLRLARAERRDIFLDQTIPVLGVTVNLPADQIRLFYQAARAFPDLTFYDGDLALALRHAAVYGTFPLARCRIEADASGRVADIHVIERPWDIDVTPPPLRILSLEPDVDPRHAPPVSLHLRFGRRSCRLAFEPARALLINLAAILRQYDPDIVLTAWGDSWLVPTLLRLAEEHHLPLPFNRDGHHAIEYRAERTYFSYGQVIYRDQQIHFFGRHHIDSRSAMLFHDYGLDGVYELGRITSLPLQTVARVSPGSGISSMQMVTALRLGILVPWHKQEPEELKTAWQLLHADQGGLVYQPTPGLHQNVAELDFISMYPSIMVHCNISPETIHYGVENSPAAAEAAQNLPPGLIPLTLGPLLEKRVEIKRRLARLPKSDPARAHYKAYASAHKWLLVTCFGYLGYKNARFGRIEAHEAVTAYGREALLRAKEAAEEAGGEVLHMYVDGLWVRSGDGSTLDTARLQPLLAEIENRTGLPIALDGIYRWVAFLPSRVDTRVPVANRYFGVFEDGTLKARGIEARRRDTPLWVAEVQMECLERLAQEPDAIHAALILPEIVGRLRQYFKDLRTGQIPVERLVVAQKLSRAVSEYRSPSPVARAAAQLEKEGRVLRPGQIVRFVFILGNTKVHAWDLSTPPDPARLDIERYSTLLLRAAATILQPFGLDEALIRQQVFYPYTLPAQTAQAGPVQLRLWPSGFGQPAGISARDSQPERIQAPEQFDSIGRRSGKLPGLPAPPTRRDAATNPAIEYRTESPAPVV